MKHIIDNLKASFDGVPWYGTAFMDIITQVDYTQAVLVPTGGSNSIAKLVAHIIAWREFVSAKLDGKAEFDIILNTIEDWPAIDINSQEDWEALVTKLQASQNHLLDQLEDLSEDIDLDGLVPGKTAEDYTIRYMLYGLVQHDTYHLGQIALTWKLIR